MIERRSASPIFVLFGVFIALFIGLRYEVGADWGTYVEQYTFASRVSFGKALGEGDYGYQIISWIAGHNDLDIWAVNLFCGAIFSWGLLRLCMAQPNPWVAIAIAIPYTVIVVGMGYTRQATALAFVMAGLADYLKRESLLRYSVYILFGALFHSTSVIAFILVAFTKQRSRFINFLVALVFAYFFYTTFISGSLDRLDAIYLRRAYSSQGAFVRVLLDVVAACLFFAFGRRLNFSETEQKVWRMFSLASFFALTSFGFVSSSTAVDRAAIYLMPLQIAVFTRIAMMSGISTVFAVLGTFALVQFSWLVFAVHAEYWLPYQAYGFK